MFCFFLLPHISFYCHPIVQEKKAKYSRQLSRRCWLPCAGLVSAKCSPTFFLPFISFKNGKHFQVNRHCGRQPSDLDDCSRKREGKGVGRGRERRQRNYGDVKCKLQQRFTVCATRFKSTLRWNCWCIIIITRINKTDLCEIPILHNANNVILNICIDFVKFLVVWIRGLHRSRERWKISSTAAHEEQFWRHLSGQVKVNLVYSWTQFKASFKHIPFRDTLLLITLILI